MFNTLSVYLSMRSSLAVMADVSGVGNSGSLRHTDRSDCDSPRADGFETHPRGSIALYHPRQVAQAGQEEKPWARRSMISTSFEQI